MRNNPGTLNEIINAIEEEGNDFESDEESDIVE